MKHENRSSVFKFKKTLLVVGPKPPPLGGGTLNVQILLDELSRHANIKTITINISPQDYHKKASLTKLETILRAVQITKKYTRCIRNSDAVLVIATSFFIFTQGCLMLLLARQHHLPFYIKPLGAELSQYLKVKNKLIRIYITKILQAATGVLVQTRQLHTELDKLGCSNTYHIPGYRPAPPFISQTKRNKEEFRLIFLSQIACEKGPLLLLEALRILAVEGRVRVACDFYGPVFEEDRKEFITQIEATSGAKYCGILDAGTASQLMKEYDGLAFTTYFINEGHPGVIIEAMQAGIPVISTQYRTVSELITDGENGFTIPMGDCHALASTIKRLALNRPLQEKMGKANYLKGQEFRSELVVPRMLEIMLPGSANPLQ